VFQLTQDERLLYVLQLEREAHVAPLAGWPDDYASWVVDLYGEVFAARKKREAGEIERIKNTVKAPRRRGS